MPEKWFTSDFLGDVTHGIQTNNAPGTKTVLFTPPYFFVIKIFYNQISIIVEKFFVYVHSILLNVLRGIFKNC